MSAIPVSSYEPGLSPMAEIVLDTESDDDLARPARWLGRARQPVPNRALAHADDIGKKRLGHFAVQPDQYIDDRHLSISGNWRLFGNIGHAERYGKICGALTGILDYRRGCVRLSFTALHSER